MYLKWSFGFHGFHNQRVQQNSNRTLLVTRWNTVAAIRIPEYKSAELEHRIGNAFTRKLFHSFSFPSDKLYENEFILNRRKKGRSGVLLLICFVLKLLRSRSFSRRFS